MCQMGASMIARDLLPDLMPLHPFSVPVVPPLEPPAGALPSSEDGRSDGLGPGPPLHAVRRQTRRSGGRTHRLDERLSQMLDAKHL